jgi:hypothetical protein
MWDMYSSAYCLNSVCHGYGYEVDWLSQAVHDDPYWVVPTRGARQTHDEVHADVLPFSLGNTQGLQVFGGSQMICFDSSAGVTLWHILGYFSLHSCPPEILLQILVHLVGSRMNRIPWAVGLVHDLTTKLKVLQNHETVLEPQNSLSVLSEALSFSRLHSLAEMTHSNVPSLGGNDVFFDSWNESYVV